MSSEGEPPSPPNHFKTQGSGPTCHRQMGESCTNGVALSLQVGERLAVFIIQESRRPGIFFTSSNSVAAVQTIMIISKHLLNITIAQNSHSMRREI